VSVAALRGMRDVHGTSQWGRCPSTSLPSLAPSSRRKTLICEFFASLVGFAAFGKAFRL
jgi:hypothetical protein